MNQSDVTQIYEDYADRVYRYMRYRMLCDHDAEDLTSAVFERVMAKLDRFDPRKGSFEAWLFTIARNLLRDHARRVKGRRALALEAAYACSATEGLPEQALLEAERFAALTRALAQLSEREAQVISLKYAAGLRNVDIARVLTLSEKNVGVILCRALKRLRQIMMEEESI